MLQNIDTKKLKLLAQASKGIAQTCCEQERSGLRYSNENLSLLWRCAQDWDAMLYLRKEHARNLHTRVRGVLKPTKQPRTQGVCNR